MILYAILAAVIAIAVVTVGIVIKLVGIGKRYVEPPEDPNKPPPSTPVT